MLRRNVNPAAQRQRSVTFTTRRHHPQLARCRPSNKTAASCSEFLQSSLGCSPAYIQRLEVQLPDLPGIYASGRVRQNVEALLGVLIGSEVSQLLLAQPALLQAPVPSWMEFFISYGISAAQVKDMILRHPELMVEGSLVRAGAAIRRLQDLGFDDDEIIHRVLAYAPRVLIMEDEQIDMLIRLWSKFATGIDQRC